LKVHAISIIGLFINISIRYYLGVTIKRKIYKPVKPVISMEIKDLSKVEKDHFGAEKREKPWNTDSDNLDSIGRDKIESLEDQIEEIEGLVEEREQLSKIVFDDAEKVKIEINNFLRELHPIDQDSMKDKITLKQKQVELAELQLKEKINCWQDVAKLKQELRECKKELTNRQSRIDMIGKILEE
jgi:hypothetical protein